jgi:hypothetical protein
LEGTRVSQFRGLRQVGQRARGSRGGQEGVKRRSRGGLEGVKRRSRGGLCSVGQCARDPADEGSRLRPS